MHNSSGIVKGIAIGLVAGAAVGFVVMPKSRDTRRAAGKFLRTCSEVVDTVSNILH
ncbi:MAG: YtxH domain-containing protein [Oscillospiraceae bacterium]|jgi:gas vesicle protein|nr:YtxH domain-containing protein [Oscillospiraceae bacterium]